MEIIKLGSQPSVKGPEDWFTCKACFSGPFKIGKIICQTVKWVSNFIL